MGVGGSFPKMGLGTALIKTEKDIDVIYQAIKDGVRLIDTEPANEILVGKAIKKAIDDRIVQREDLLIITKLELDEKDDPNNALQRSLDRLQLDHVDLYLDHWPSCINYLNSQKTVKISLKDTWKKMENLVLKGLTKFIGLSNYNVENIFNVLSICMIRPYALEVEFNPYLFQGDLKEFCDKENIKLIAYNPLAKGEYCDKDYIRKHKLDLFNEGMVKVLAKYFKKTKGQIILNWHKCLGVIPIPGTSKKERMKENLGALDFKMDKIFVDLLSSFEDKQHRFIDGSKIFGIDIFA
jgi:diketogulonate reductase-like aldo/keto reductase